MVNKKYVVEITETYKKRICVDANDKNDAFFIVEDLYNDGDVELTKNDFYTVEFDVLNEYIVYRVMCKNKTYGLIACDNGYQLIKQENVCGETRTWYYDTYPTWKIAVEELNKYIKEDC